VDIIAEEVSDVDRAANRRRYLAIKRENDGDEDSLGPEIFDDEDTDSDPEDAALAKARRSRTDEDEEESEDEESEDGELADVFEGDEESESDEEDEDEEAEEDDDRPKPRRRKARKEAQALSANTKAALLRRTAPVLERMTKLVASIQRAAEAPERGSQATPAWVTRELQGICNELEQLVGPASKSATKPVHKVGAKMASQRREQLKGAVELLQRLLQEVMPELAASRAPGLNPPQPAPTAKSAKRAPEEHGEFGALLASMTEGISALTNQVKTQAAELARLKKSTGLPASRPVESVRRPVPPAQEEDWPFDMNAPLSRDRVAKEISFFDE
jgi:hypothetical protein